MPRVRLLAAAALSLLFLGCTAGSGDDQNLDPRRGPLGKADSHGTCQGACGGQSQDGSCWCDDQCEFYGDCCDDYTPTCTGESDTCGGFAGLQCSEGEFCEYDSCGADFGACKPRPDACIEIFAPVCGCDGVTYANECYAHGNGATVDHDGACEGNGQELCQSDSDCSSDETCDQSECHTPPCPPGMNCPQVCYGVCSDELPAPDSCEGNCGGPAPSGCYCDEVCTEYGDCCDDYQDACTVEPSECEAAGGSCHINSPDPCPSGTEPASLSCDVLADVCCVPEQACCDPAEQPGTNGNPFCIEGATCCADGTWACNMGDGSPTCDPGSVCEM